MDRFIGGRFSAADEVSSPHRSAEMALMARIGAYLYAAGATLALVWLALPHPMGSNDLMLVATLAVSYTGAGVLWYRGERLKRWGFEVVVAIGTVLITVAVHFSGRSGTPFLLFYLW